jgi:phosphate transport system substrate-binding protein
MTIAGSTSVEPFAELLAEEYMRLHPGAYIYVQGGGSTAGVEAARSHAANIGMSSRSLLPSEKDLSAVMIARDAIALIVHPGNPIRNLSLVQVRDVFSGKIKRWKEVGGPDHPIVLVTREEGSGTREAFQKFVMGKEEISLAALVQDSNGAIRQVVSGDPNSIGYISLGLVNEKVIAMEISGVEASVSNIENGSYTLVRPFLFLFDGEPSLEAKAFVDFVLSPQAQKILSKEGLVSILPRAAQK